jgi:hypothetical protein
MMHWRLRCQRNWSHGVKRGAGAGDRQVERWRLSAESRYGVLRRWPNTVAIRGSMLKERASSAASSSREIKAAFAIVGALNATRESSRRGRRLRHAGARVLIVPECSTRLHRPAIRRTRAETSSPATGWELPVCLTLLSRRGSWAWSGGGCWWRRRWRCPRRGLWQ